MFQNTRPLRIQGVTAYYQGRPNTLFLGRYRTLEERSARTPW